MTSAAKNAGATIVDHHFHAFAPQGISGVVIIKESHLSIHTWPEHNFASIDIYTCGELIDFKKAEETLKKAFSAKKTKRKYLTRG